MRLGMALDWPNAEDGAAAKISAARTQTARPVRTLRFEFMTDSPPRLDRNGNAGARYRAITGAAQRFSKKPEGTTRATRKRDTPREWRVSRIRGPAFGRQA